MGDHWLHALPDHLSDWKLPFNLVDGWRTRSRSTGGFDDPGPMGVVCHHTVSNTSPQNDIHFCINVSESRPIGSGLFDRQGVFWFHTAGATNTNGRGGPWFMDTGIVPLDSGNRRLAGIEAANNGVGEVWTPQQVENYPILVACFLACIKSEFGLPTSPNCTLAHHEWAPTRKTDPSGPSPWGGPGRTLWNMDGFRGAVLRAQLDQNPPPEPSPEPPVDDLLLLGGTTMKPRIAKLADGQFFFCTGVAVQPKTAQQVDYLIDKLRGEVDDLKSPREVTLGSHRDVSEVSPGALAAFGRLVAGSD